MSTLVNPTIGNPVEPFLRSDRMPHIWCPGCGIGTTVNCFAQALIESKIDLQSLALVSGIHVPFAVGKSRIARSRC